MRGSNAATGKTPGKSLTKPNFQFPLREEKEISLHQRHYIK